MSIQKRYHSSINGAGDLFSNKKLLLISAFLSFLLISCGGAGNVVYTTAHEPLPKVNQPAVPPVVKVAFIADQGSGEGATAVLKLIRDENADMLLHQGDFDYKDSPDLWMQQIDNALGAEFPVFASIGNHDRAAWEGYQSKLEARLNNIKGVTCAGDLGVNSACIYKGLFFVLSGIGTRGDDHIDHLQKYLTASTAHWKICSWHKNQRLMQVGGKQDAVGWEVYEACRSAGAIIATGHEHSYSRTYLMSNFESQTVASTSSELMLSEGKSFAFVSGLGGKSIRSQNDFLGSNLWWASVYSASEGANHGALFCTFNVNNNKHDAECYFKDIAGKIVDSFSIYK